MPDDYYRILGVNPGCSQEEIKQAYRSLAKRHHPDVNRSAKASETMKRINIAYAILADPHKRKEYDDNLREIRSRQYAGGTQSQGRYRAGNVKSARRKNIFNLWAKSAGQAIVIVLFIVLMAGSIIFVYLTNSNDTIAPDNGQDQYSVATPTTNVAIIPAGTLEVPTAPMATPTKNTPTPTPNAIVTPLPSPSAFATIDPMTQEKPHVAAVPPPGDGSMGAGIIIGHVMISGSIIGADGAYVAICDAANTDREYYTTTAGLDGYFQFSNINNTLAPNGTPEETYVLYAWDAALDRGNFSTPFAIEPFHILTEDMQV
jgi:hypothetical protein